MSPSFKFQVSSLAPASPWLELSRLSNAPTVVTNVLAGAAIASGPASPGRLAGLALAMLLLYVAGMFLNDVCDYAIDCVERPERPLPRAAVSRRAVLLAALALLAAGLGILACIGVACLVAGTALVGLIILYDLWHKANPCSSVVMGACRATVYLAAGAAVATPPSAALIGAATLLGVYIVAITLVARHESGRDRPAYWPAALLLAPPVAVLVTGPGATGAAIAAVALCLAWILYSLSFVYGRGERQIGAAIGRLLAGICLYDAIVIAMYGEPAHAVIALLGFGLTLALQRVIPAT